MKPAVIKIVLPALLVGAFLCAIFYSLKKEPFTQSEAKTLSTAQQADAPLGYTGNGDVESKLTYQPALHRFSAFDRVQFPLARYFEPEVKFNDGNIAAMADGFVVYSAKNKDWGETVVLAHKLTDGRVVLSYYGQLKVATAQVGKLLGRGQIVGKGDAGKIRRELYQTDGIVFPTKANPMAKLKVDLPKFLVDYNPQKVPPVSALTLILEKEKSAVPFPPLKR